MTGEASQAELVELQRAKRTVLDYGNALDAAGEAELGLVVRKGTTDDYRWRGVHPFDEQAGSDAATEVFWRPLRRAFTGMQRRPDVFLAGRDDVDGGQTTWVCQMGHLMGLFDRSWLDIPPTGRLALVPFAEFHRVDDDQIAETAMFVDVISVMRQAGHDPLPPQTGASFVRPGPLTHDGLLLDEQDPAEGAVTMALINRMIDDLDTANRLATHGSSRMDASVLAETWHDDMLWMGPEGIGATYTIQRYQQQHQLPFRLNLADKSYYGHVARIAEGAYGGFFGWANLTNRPTGGFLGLPASSMAEMRVVDVYRRQGDRLAENWVFIDLLHWLSMQGLDLLARMRQLTGQEEL